MNYEIPDNFVDSRNNFPIFELNEAGFKSNIESLNGKYKIIISGPFMIFKDAKTNNYSFVLYLLLYTLESKSDSKKGQTIFTLCNENLNQEHSVVFDGKRDDITNILINAQTTALNAYFNVNPNKIVIFKKVRLVINNTPYEEAMISKQNSGQLQLQYFNDGTFDVLEFEITKNFKICTGLRQPTNTIQVNLTETFTLRHDNEEEARNIYVVFYSPKDMLSTFALLYEFKAIIDGLISVDLGSSPPTPTPPPPQTAPPPQLPKPQQQEEPTQKYRKKKKKNPADSEPQTTKEVSTFNFTDNLNIENNNENQYKEFTPIPRNLPTFLKKKNNKVDKQIDLDTENEGDDDKQEESEKAQTNTAKNNTNSEADSQDDTKMEKHSNNTNDIFALPPEIKSLVKQPKEQSKSIDPKTIFMNFIYPLSDSQYQEEINKYKNRINSINMKIDDVPDDPPKVEKRPQFDVNAPINLNERPKNQQVSKLELQNFVPKTVELSEDDIKTVLCDSLQLLPDSDETQMNNYFHEIVFDNFQTVIQKALSRIPSQSQVIISKTFNFNSCSKTYDIHKLDDNRLKPNCSFLTEFVRTVQEILISGTFLHRDEKAPQQLVQLISAFFLNGLIDRDLRSLFDDILTIMPPFKEYIDECKRKENTYDQISLFAIYALNTKLYLPLLRNVKNCVSLKEKHYEKTALIWDIDVIEKMSDVIEPMLMYHNFMLSPYKTLIDEKCPFIKPSFLYRKIQELPKLYNIDDEIDLISLCISDGLKVNLWKYIVLIVKKKIEFPGYNELQESMIDIKKEPKEKRIKLLLKQGFEKQQIYNWICSFVANSSPANFTSDASLLDPARASLILKSVFIVQPPLTIASETPNTKIE